MKYYLMLVLGFSMLASIIRADVYYETEEGFYEEGSRGFSFLSNWFGNEADVNDFELRNAAEGVSREVTFFGLYTRPVSKELSAQMRFPKGYYLAIENVTADSPASRAGLEQYDVLMEFDKQIIVNPEQLKTLVRSKKGGDVVTVKVLRIGQPQEFSVTLESKRIVEEESFWKNPFRGGSNLGVFNPEKMKEMISNLRGEHTVDSMQCSSCIKSGKQVFVRESEDGSIKLSCSNEGKHLEALDGDGEVIFEGFVNTEKERKEIPPTILSQLEELEKIQDFSCEGQSSKDCGNKQCDSSEGCKGEKECSTSEGCSCSKKSGKKIL